MAEKKTEKSERFGLYLRNLRVNSGLSLRDAAEQAGLTPTELGEFERGVRYALPSDDDIPVDEFIKDVAKKLAKDSLEQRIVDFLIMYTRPRLFMEIQKGVIDIVPFNDFRQVDRALQRLRKAGKITYLKKKEGGPGWVLIERPSKHVS